jgi:hypothetical protein
MMLFSEISGEEFIGFHVISATIFVEVLIIGPVGNFSLNEFFDKFTKMGEGTCTYSVCAIHRPLDWLIPSEVGGTFGEVLAEIKPEIFSDLFGVSDFSFEVHVV